MRLSQRKKKRERERREPTVCSSGGREDDGKTCSACGPTGRQLPPAAKVKLLQRARHAFFSSLRNERQGPQTLPGSAPPLRPPAAPAAPYLRRVKASERGGGGTSAWKKEVNGRGCQIREREKREAHSNNRTDRGTNTLIIQKKKEHVSK